MTNQAAREGYMHVSRTSRTSNAVSILLAHALDDTGWPKKTRRIYTIFIVE